MPGLLGRYDVLVAGAGVTGVTAAIAAGREGAQVLLVEGTGFVGGNVTAGRLTKPTGTIEGGVFREMMERAAEMGGAIEGVGAAFGVPYRCLLPAGVEGLLVAGRCISVDKVAFGATRNIPSCALTGEAAGIAATLAARGNVTPRRLDVREVQTALRRRKIPLGTADERAGR